MNNATNINCVTTSDNDSTLDTEFLKCYNVFLIVHYLIGLAQSRETKNKKENKATIDIELRMTNMRLQKMLYFAWGIYWAISEKCLFVQGEDLVISDESVVNSEKVSDQCNNIFTAKEDDDINSNESTVIKEENIGINASLDKSTADFKKTKQDNLNYCINVLLRENNYSQQCIFSARCSGPVIECVYNKMNKLADGTTFRVKVPFTILKSDKRTIDDDFGRKEVKYSKKEKTELKEEISRKFKIAKKALSEKVKVFLQIFDKAFANFYTRSLEKCPLEKKKLYENNLRDLSHDKNGPWYKAFNNRGYNKDGNRSNAADMDIEDVKKYFEEIGSSDKNNSEKTNEQKKLIEIVTLLKKELEKK